MARKAPENPALEKAMQAVIDGDSPETRAGLYRELIKAVLLIPTARAAGSSGWKTLDKETDVELVIGKNDRGEPTIPAFTNDAAMGEWLPKASAYIGLRGSQLFQIAVDLKVSSVSINPAGPVGGELLPAELRALAEEKVPGGPDMETITLSRLGTMRFKAPGEPPPKEFVERIRDRAASYPEIRRAFLFCLQSGSGKEHYMIGIEFARFMEPKQAKSVFRELGESIGPMLGTNETIDLIDLKAMGMLSEVEKLGPAVYAQG